MKKKSILLFIGIISCIFSNAQNLSIVAGYKHYYDLTQIEFPFIYKELFNIYKFDSAFVYGHFIKNRQSKDLNDVDLYMNDMCAKALKDSLLKLSNDVESKEFDRIMTFLGNIEPRNPNVNWNGVFQICDECPFGDMPTDVIWNVKFSLIYMSEAEINQMINYKNGEQWNFVLLGIKNGDYFTGLNSIDKGLIEIDRRVMQFLIDKWSPCQIPEVQELVKVLKESMPLEELANPVDVITGTWRGAFGNKTINFTINYDASIAEAEKEHAKQTRWGMFTNCYFGVLGTSLFDGQPESKSVQSKGYYTDGGKAVQINLIEQPDTAQWNGEFNIWIDRKTNMMHGTWESNNKKLKREFELEKVKE